MWRNCNNRGQEIESDIVSRLEQTGFQSRFQSRSRIRVMYITGREFH